MGCKEAGNEVFPLTIPYRPNDTFYLTYGDGVGNIDIKKLLAHHKKSKKISTMTVVKPQGRFGSVSLSNDSVTKFVEKPKEIVVENSFAKGTPSPASSKILSEKIIPLSSVAGSGRGGRFT